MFASRLTRDGVDIVTVKELLGHANISITMRYAHSKDDAKRRAVQKLTRPQRQREAGDGRKPQPEARQ